jgi:hypothetical protein
MPKIWGWFVLSFVFVTRAFAAESTQSNNFNDHLTVHYWGKYSGPSIGAFGDTTPDFFGIAGHSPQMIDDNLTAGYQITPYLRPGIGIPFNILPAKEAGVQLKPIYIGVINAKLLDETSDWALDMDARLYLPIGDVAAAQDVITGFRTSQNLRFKIPGSRWTVGSSSFVRAWVYGNSGHGFRNDWEIYFSPNANYRINGSVLATLWVDVLQLGYAHNTSRGFSNLPLDIQPGIKWEITPRVNINPYINIIPQSLSLESTSLGMVMNAVVL